MRVASVVSTPLAGSRRPFAWTNAFLLVALFALAPASPARAAMPAGTLSTPAPPAVNTADGQWSTFSFPPGSGPTDRSSFSTAYDPVRKRVLLFGGYVQDTVSGAFVFPTDVWALSTTGTPTWKLLNPSGTPPSLSDQVTPQAMVYDPVRDRLVVFNRSNTSIEVWALTFGVGDGTWSALPSQNIGLPPLYITPMAAYYSPLSDIILLWTGNRGEVYYVEPSVSPFLKFYGQSSSLMPDFQTTAFDPTRGKLYAFGGVNSSGVWVLNGGFTAWQLLSVAGPPPPERYLSSFTYDPTRDRLLVYGGQSIDSYLTDTWSLPLNAPPQWQSLAPTGSPSPLLQSPIATYDTGADRLLVQDASSPGVVSALTFGPPSNIAGEDLTTTSQSKWARYLVNVGAISGDTRLQGVASPDGVSEISSHGGNGGPWWQVNDGVQDRCNTFGGVGPDYVGYRFKYPVDLKSFSFENAIYSNGGTFRSTPAVQVFDGTNWSTVAATCTPSYDTTFAANAYRTYSFVLSNPAHNIQGVRLFGATAGTADGDGFVGVSELTAFGQPLFPRRIDWTTDLTAEAGTEPYLNGGIHDEGKESIDDDPLTGLGTNGHVGTDDNMGVLWAAPQDSVTALGAMLVFSPGNSGGWLDDSVIPFRIEYTRDHGATWQPVTGLTKGTYDADYPRLAAIPSWSPMAPYLFTFDPVNGINGLRLIGDGGGNGDTDGYFAVNEMEVFATNASHLPPVAGRFNLHATGALAGSRFTNLRTPAISFGATAPGITDGTQAFLATLDCRSPNAATRMYNFSAPDPVTVRPEVPGSVPMELFQTQRTHVPVDTNFVAHPMHWRFPVAPGSYDVRLLFAEIYPGGFAKGYRVFRIKLEGTTVRDNFDIFAAVGARAGTVRTFTTTALDGALDLELEAITDVPAIAGIEVSEHGTGTLPLYRVNCGGPRLPAADGSLPDWQADQEAIPFEQFRNWAPDSTWTLPPLVQGQHFVTLQSRAIGAQRDTLFVPFVVDTTPPVPAAPTGLTPGAAINVTSATFTLGATDNFESLVAPTPTWRLDGAGPFQRAPAGTVSLTGLAPGRHVFEASARDTAGNVAAKAESLAFAVDLTKPVALIQFEPSPNDTVTSTAAAFAWSGSDNLTPTAQLLYQAAFDQTPFGPPSALVTRDLSGLADGPHTFRLQAIDQAGNGSDVVTRSFFLDSHAPLVSFVGPGNDTCVSAPAVDFSWTIDDGGVTPPARLLSSYRLDGAAYTAYAQVGAFHAATLNQGKHAFDLRVRDAAGNVTTVSRTFQVDFETPFAYAPTARVLDNQQVAIQATGTDNEGIVAFAIQVAESTLFTPTFIDTVVDARGQLQFTGVPGHTYLARAQAIDCAGNHSVTSPVSGPAVVANLPNLVASNVTAPAAANSGQAIQVGWKVTNLGLGGTVVPSWLDRVYLCDTRTFDASRAIVLGEAENLTFLDHLEAYDSKLFVALPRAAQGKYYVFVATDANGGVAETDGDDNLSPPDSIQVTQSNAANLDLEALQGPTDEIAGDVITLTYKVRNYGLARTDVAQWFDTVFLTQGTNLRINAGSGNTLIFLDQPLGAFEHDGALAADSAYTNVVRVRLPVDASGLMHLFVFADQNVSAAGQSVPQMGSVFENGADFNYGTTGAPLRIDINVVPRNLANLHADAISAPDSAVSGTDIPVQWTVSNPGLGATLETAWTDRVYLSTDPVLQTQSDPALADEVRYGSLATDQHYDVSRTVHLPDFKAGTYYLIVQTDVGSQVPESDETDNVVTTVKPIHVDLQDWPNLVVTSASVPDSARAGTTIQATWEVRNAGLGAATGPWSDRLYLTPTPVWDANAARALGAVAGTTPLAAPGFYDHAAGFAIPPTLPAGTWTAWVVTDDFNQVNENTDEGDNRRLAGTIVVAAYPPIDLAASDVSAAATVGTGQTLGVSWHVANNGSGTTLGTSWFDEVWLSKDTVQDGSDFVFGFASHGGALAPGDAYDASVTAKVPDGFAAGDYYVLVGADQSNSSGDGIPANNFTRSATPIHITATPPPNLVVRNLVVTGPAVAGQPITIAWTVANIGLGPTTTTASGTAFYLSTDATLNNGDILLDSELTPMALAPGDSLRRVISVELPNYLQGPYYLIAVVDAQQLVYEGSNKGDNTTVAPPLPVSVAPPADLVVQSVQGPASATPGDPIDVSWTDANTSTTNAATGVMRDVVYVSADDTFDPDTDPVVGVVTRTINLAPQQAATFRVTLPTDHTYQVDDQGNVTAELPALSPGHYKLIVRTNVKHNIRELNYDNNALVAADTMRVDIPVLALGGQLTVTAHPGQSRYFRVDTPAGKDVELDVTSGENDATNLLYVAFGHTPSPGAFDFEGPPEFTSAPSVSIPGSNAGSYYLLVYTDALPGGATSQQLTVSARALPFQVTSASPDSGAGSVTCTIRGAGFGPNTRFFLQIKPGLRLEAGRAILNSQRARAQFNLSGFAPTSCSLIAVNGDTTVTAPDPFVVQAPLPLSVAAAIDRPDFVRQNQTGTFIVHLVNTSNQDIPYVRARVEFPGTAQLVSLVPSAGLLRHSDLDPLRYAPVTGDVERLFDAGSGDSLAVVDVVGRALPPGQEYTLALGIRGFTNSRFSIRALTSGLTTEQFIARAIDDAEAVRLAASLDPGSLPLSVQALLSSPGAFRDSALANTWIANGVLPEKSVTAYMRALPGGALGGSDPPQGSGPDALTGPTTDCVLPTGDPGCSASLGASASVLPACASCFLTAPLLRVLVPQAVVARVQRPSCMGFDGTAIADLQVVSPCDPNAINGPAGFGARHWVNASQSLKYTVNFENLPDTASAAAQVVTVRVPLGAGVDTTSFRLGDVGFGSLVLSGLDGRTQGSDSVIVSGNTEATVLAGVDQTKGEAFWIFRTIDRTTHQVPAGDVGFLPVNDGTGRGTGFVDFTIRPARNLAPGNTIEERATVQFDQKLPLPTATTSNPVDVGRPTSHVTNVAALSENSVRIRWADSDDSTGVRFVTVYAQQDNGRFTRLADSLSAGETVLPVTPGSSYGFYTIATDNAGNTEAKPASDEGTIQAPGTVDAPGTDIPIRFALLQNAPNPFRDATLIRFDLPRAAVTTLEIYTVAGRRLESPLVQQSLPPGHHSVSLGGTRFAPGVYFYRIVAGPWRSTKKMVVVP